MTSVNDLNNDLASRLNRARQREGELLMAMGDSIRTGVVDPVLKAAYEAAGAEICAIGVEAMQSLRVRTPDDMPE